jgi:hypothetical protein
MYALQQLTYGYETYITNEWLFEDYDDCLSFGKTVEYDRIEEVDDDYISNFNNKIMYREPKLREDLENLIMEIKFSKLLNTFNENYLGYSINTNFNDYKFLIVELSFRSSCLQNNIYNQFCDYFNWFLYQSTIVSLNREIIEEDDKLVYVFNFRKQYLKNKKLLPYFKVSGMELPSDEEGEEKFQKFHDEIIKKCLFDINNLHNQLTRELL